VVEKVCSHATGMSAFLGVNKVILGCDMYLNSLAQPLYYLPHLLYFFAQVNSHTADQLAILTLFSLLMLMVAFPRPLDLNQRHYLTDSPRGGSELVGLLHSYHHNIGCMLTQTIGHYCNNKKM
jgi:hypothetical protein